jgi:metal-responsive CopG/Arc/MetJ family transcriptional regulator
MCILKQIKGETTMHQRINITLPEKTIRLIDRVAQNRSRFIDQAVKHYIRSRSKKTQAAAQRRIHPVG